LIKNYLIKFSVTLKKIAFSNRLNALPPELQGRIADFVGTEDRAKMRTLSRDNRVIYDPRPSKVFNIRQRLTLVDLQSGVTGVYKTPAAQVSVNQFSTEIGSAEDIRRILDLTNTPTTPSNGEPYEFEDYVKVGGWHANVFHRGGRFGGRAFQVLTDFLNQDREEYGDFVHEWPRINNILTSNMVDEAFTDRSVEEGEEKLNYSLFGVAELQQLIRERMVNARTNQFPITFVKVREINLLDYAFITFRRFGTAREHTPVRTIDDLVEYQHEGFPSEENPNEDNPEANDQGLKLMLIHKLGGNGSTTLDALRPFARYRYTHEIHVDLVSSGPLSFPVLPGQDVEEEEDTTTSNSTTIGRGGASSQGSRSAGGGSSSSGGKRRRE
jgi:hypothetical protein